VTGHRHHPEIAQGLTLLAAKPVNLVFVPHLVPMIRGIHATLYARLTATADLQSLYENAMQARLLSMSCPPASHPDTRSVRGEITAVSRCTGRRAAITSSCCR